MKTSSIVYDVKAELEKAAHASNSKVFKCKGANFESSRSSVEFLAFPLPYIAQLSVLRFTRMTRKFLLLHGGDFTNRRTCKAIKQWLRLSSLLDIRFRTVPRTSSRISHRFFPAHARHLKEAHFHVCKLCVDRNSLGNFPFQCFFMSV